MAQTHKGLETVTGHEAADPFRHEAMFYAGEDDFVSRVGEFIRAALDSREPVLVAVSHRKIDLLKQDLGRDASRVVFADMDDLGRNPGRIIPLWIDFLNEAAADGGSVRGVGEPISPGRTQEELVEAERHESLLNVAFGASPLWLVCPYDTTTLDATVLEQARRNHPVVADADGASLSSAYPGLAAFARPFDTPLPEPAVPTRDIAVTIGRLDAIRRTIAQEAESFGLQDARIADLVLCVNEIATNSILHGGGKGTLRLWTTSEAIVCEISDAGRIEDPLAGQSRPVLGHASGYGLWLSNQLCDLVQMRTLQSGTVVRLTMRR